MSTITSVLNGLERSVQYTSDQVNSSNLYYSRGIEQLEQIRDMASVIMTNANNALKRVGKFDPKYDISNKTSDVIVLENSEDKNDVIDIAAKVSAAIILELSKNSNSEKIVTQQVIKNQINNISYDKHIEDKHEEVIEDPVEIPRIDKKESISSFRTLEEHRKEKVVKKKEIPNSFSKKFKKPLLEVSSLPDSQFEYAISKECADMISTFFSVRFDSRNDPKHIHKYDQKRYKDYLVSFILAYSDACVHESLNKFENEFDSWIKKVESGSCKYTMPKSVAVIFFNTCLESKRNNRFYLDSKSVKLAVSIWHELWNLGYNSFENMFDDKYSNLVPSYHLEWIQSKIISSMKKRQGIKKFENSIDDKIEDDIEIITDKQEKFNLSDYELNQINHCKKLIDRISGIPESEFEYKNTKKYAGMLCRYLNYRYSELGCELKCFGDKEGSVLFDKIHDLSLRDYFVGALESAISNEDRFYKDLDYLKYQISEYNEYDKIADCQETVVDMDKVVNRNYNLDEYTKDNLLKVYHDIYNHGLKVMDGFDYDISWVSL